MKFTLILCSLSLASLLIAGDGKPPVKKVLAPSVEKMLIQLEHEWNEALIHRDYKTVDRIMAEEWTGIDFKGLTITKAESMAELRSESSGSGNQAVELGAMTVKVYGDTAVVVGSDTETSTYQGKDSSGKYAWMDVFVKRAGRWQVVASQSTKIGK